MANRVLLFGCLLVIAWCVMTFTHEMGHIVGGLCCGGRLQTADLLPWHLPYSIFEPDPMPLVTLWCGPLLGAIVPGAAALIVRRNWMWFIAYFCIVANGAYLATAWLSGDRYLDTARLLKQGAHPITIGAYCIITIAIGYAGFRQSCMRILKSPEEQKGNDLSDRDSEEDDTRDDVDV